MSFITLRNLKKVYHMGNESVAALDGIDLNISKGEFCCLLGTSGSGKSTLLNMMAGLEKPTSGEIIIKDMHIAKMDENEITNYRRHNIGFVFQSYNLLPNFTALENVMFPLIFNEIPEKERIERAKEMLTCVGLGERFHHRPIEMSGGQQQRVSLARALITYPEILFADEPTGNLDSNTTIEMMDLITRITRQNNQTVIMVTHDVETSQYCDKIVCMKDGLITDVKINVRE